MSSVRVLVGTRKGAFVYRGDNARKSWQLEGPHFLGNIVNHPQYIPGSNPGTGLGINDVAGFNTITGGYLNYLTPGNANFNNPKSVFASNARTMAIIAKFTF